MKGFLPNPLRHGDTFPWAFHLTLMEVYEHEQLQAMSFDKRYRHGVVMRFKYLTARRFPPVYRDEPESAA